MLTDNELDDTCELMPNEELFERLVPGEEPLWFWAQTCAEDDCPCRGALLVAASSREQALAHAAVVRELWQDELDAEAFAAKLPEGIVAFETNIDSGNAAMPMSYDTTVSESVARAHRQIDGELLDALNRLWFQGKEQEDLSSVPVDPREIEKYRPGQLLAWDEVYQGARVDVYTLEGVSFEAIETFCVRPECQCNDVHIQFYQLPPDADEDLDDEDTDDEDTDDEDTDDEDTDDEDTDDEDTDDEDTDDEDLHDDADSDQHDDGHVYLGMVSVIIEDPIKIQMNPSEGQSEQLKAVFDRYRARYPHLGPRLAQRADKMTAFGKKLHAHLNPNGGRAWVSSSRKRRNQKR